MFKLSEFCLKPQNQRFAACGGDHDNIEGAMRPSLNVDLSAHARDRFRKLLTKYPWVFSVHAPCYGVRWPDAMHVKGEIWEAESPRS